MIAHAEGRPSLSQPLRVAAARTEGDAVVLEFPPDFAAFAALHADEYRDLAKKAAGRAVKLQVVAGTRREPCPASPAGEKGPGAAPPDRRQRLLDEASGARRPGGARPVRWPPRGRPRAQGVVSPEEVT